MKYRELNLIDLRKKADIDFAHYTYKRGQCSCCYGPKDLPKRYWKDNVVSNKDYDDISYILFKNADNGSGIVKKDDTLIDDFIEWNLSDSQLENVCRLLKDQVGDDYYVVIPKGKYECIRVVTKNKIKNEYMEIKRKLMNPSLVLNKYWARDKSEQEIEDAIASFKCSGSNLMNDFKDILYIMYKGENYYKSN